MTTAPRASSPALCVGGVQDELNGMFFRASPVDEERLPARLGHEVAERVAALAAEAGQPIDAFVQRVLQGLVDADIELRDGIPVFRMPPDAPVLTSADVDRLLHNDVNS